MTDEELKPCPFCGGEGASHQTALSGRFHVFCLACDAEGPWCNMEAEAIAAWNRRTDDPR